MVRGASSCPLTLLPWQYFDYLLEIEQKATLFCEQAFSPYRLPPNHLLVADIGSNTLDWPLEAQRGLEDGREF